MHIHNRHQSARIQNTIHGTSFRCWLAVLAGVILIMTTGLAADGDNLIQNGEMSGGGSKGVPGWKYRRDYSAAKDMIRNGWRAEPETGGGSVFIKIVNASDKGANEWWWQQVVCEPGATYRLMVEARSEGTDHRADVLVDFPRETDSSGALKNEYKVVGKIADTQPAAPRQFFSPEWKLFSGEFTVPLWATKTIVRLGMMGKSEAEVSYRNVKLEKL